MNWLAHVLLSPNNIDFQLGNYLADPLKGQVWDEASQDLRAGIQTHISIDSFTDSHPLVSRSKSRLRPKGLLKPVIIDLTYDYLLTQHWDRFCTISQREFLDSFNQAGEHRALSFPSKPQELILNLTQNDRLNRYNTLEELLYGFQRIDTRLSPRLRAKELASGYYADVLTNLEGIEEDFLEFFPSLVEYIERELDTWDIIHLKSTQPLKDQ